MDMAAHYDVLSNAVRTDIADDFGAIGIELTSMIIENISLPAEIEQAIDAAAAQSARGVDNTMGWEAMQGMRDVARNAHKGGGTGGVMGAGMGMGMGMGMGNMMGAMMGGAGGYPPPGYPPQGYPPQGYPPQGHGQAPPPPAPSPAPAAPPAGAAAHEAQGRLRRRAPHPKTGVHRKKRRAARGVLASAMPLTAPRFLSEDAGLFMSLRPIPTSTP